jgi:hypothetical protein
MDTLSFRGYGIFRKIDLSKGTRSSINSPTPISLRSLLAASLPGSPVLKVEFDYYNTKMIATWSVDPNAASYELQQSQDIDPLEGTVPAQDIPGILTWTSVYVGTDTTFSVANPGGDFQFTFRLRSSNPIGTGSWSESGLGFSGADNPPPPSPPSLDYWATPTDPPGWDHKPPYLDSRINIGESATLHWQVTNCDNCSLSLQGKDFDTKKVVLNVPRGLSSSGSLKVTPPAGTNTWIEYTLTAAGKNGTASLMRKVSVYYPSKQADLQMFWFKMTNPQSVLSCFTLGIDAKDLPSAKTAAQSYLDQGGYVGYTIAKLSGEAEATTACGG